MAEGHIESVMHAFTFHFSPITSHVSHIPPMITLQHINPTATRVYMGTLTGGVEVHPALIEVARAQAIHTATFELLGGLTEVEFRSFDFEGQKRKPPITFTRPMEIVSGHGTLSLLDGEPNVHLHLAVAFGDTDTPHGISVVGGHVTRAVAHALEFTLTAYEGAPVHRKLDEGTGLMLWKLPELKRDA